MVQGVRTAANAKENARPRARVRRVPGMAARQSPALLRVRTDLPEPYPEEEGSQCRRVEAEVRPEHAGHAACHASGQPRLKAVALGLQGPDPGGDAQRAPEEGPGFGEQGSRVDDREGADGCEGERPEGRTASPGGVPTGRGPERAQCGGEPAGSRVHHRLDRVDGVHVPLSEQGKDRCQHEGVTGHADVGGREGCLGLDGVNPVPEDVQPDLPVDGPVPRAVVRHAQRHEEPQPERTERQEKG